MPYCWEVNVLPRFFFFRHWHEPQSYRVELCTAFNGLFHGNHGLIQFLWIRHRTISLLGSPRPIVAFLVGFSRPCTHTLLRLTVHDRGAWLPCCTARWIVNILLVSGLCPPPPLFPQILTIFEILKPK